MRQKDGSVLQHESPTADLPTAEQFDAYQAMAEYFNQRLFGGLLPPALLNFSRKGRRTRGFFAPNRWEKGETLTHEISLNPMVFSEQSPLETAATLVHELCHLWQEAFGSPSRAGYHNREWAEKMEAVGLMPSHIGAPGGCRTGQQMSHYVISGGPFEQAFRAMPPEYALPWLCHEGKSRAGSGTPRRASKVTYLCPGCGAKAWGKPGLLLLCGPCDRPLLSGSVTG